MNPQPQPNTFWLDPTNIPSLSDSTAQPYLPHEESYFERLQRTKRTAQALPSSSTCDQYYHPESYSRPQQQQPRFSQTQTQIQTLALNQDSSAPQSQFQTYHAHHQDMSAAVLPPAQHHFESRHDNKRAFQNNNMNNLPRQSAFSSPTPTPNNVSGVNMNASQQQSVPPPSRTMSRFQQLLNLKLAAERNASSSSQPIQVDASQLNHAFAQAQAQAANTVFHKDFIASQQTAGGYSQPIASSQKPSSEFELQPQNPRQQYQATQPHQPPFVQQSNLAQGQPQDPTGQYPQQTPKSRRTSQPVQQRAPVSLNVSSMSAPNSQQHSPDSTYNSLSVVTQPQVAFPRTSAVPVGNTWNGRFSTSSYNGRSQPFVSNQASASSSLSAPNPAGHWQSTHEPVVKTEPQWEENAGMNGWLPFAQPPQATNIQANVRQPKINTPPSFSWSVSEVRSSADAGPSYLAQQPMDCTPALSPSHALAPSASSSAPSPITPMGGPTQFASSNTLPLPYTAIKVEPDTQLLSVPYAYQTRPSTSSSESSSSPLLEYGHRMFTNMNGAFQLPGQMYMSNSADMPSTLANGMAGSNGEADSGNGDSNGWANGNGEGSGSGMGGHGGNGSGSGSGDDHNGDGGDDDQSNGTPTNGRKPKKLALACHFCRRRKLKCNGLHPICDNCTKRNETCTWDDNVRRRGPGKATKERREKAAREAAAAGLTNEDSLDVSALAALGHTPDQMGHLQSGGELPIADAIATLPAELKDVDDHPHHLPFDTTDMAGTTGAEELGVPSDMDIPIDPALAALSEAVMPHTLAELEVKKGAEKRKSFDQQLDQPEKRFKLEGAAIENV